LADGKTSMPATAKSRSGNTSVVVNPALTAAFSLSLPGTDAPCAANESTRLPCASGSSRRSAKVNRPTSPDSRITPCRNRAGPSTAIAPIAAMCALVVPYPRRERHDRREGGTERYGGHEHLGVVTGLARDERLDQHPDEAAPRMIKVGDNCPYSIFGASIFEIGSAAVAAVVHRLWTAVALTWPPPPRAWDPSCVRRTWSA
jgi:hypothetical protein